MDNLFSSLVIYNTKLWSTCNILPEHSAETKEIASQIIKNKSSYEEVSKVTGIPFYVIGILHFLEASFENCWLANGDSLDGRTVNEPAGLIPDVDPPYTFEQAAIYSLQYDAMDSHQWEDASIPYVLSVLEQWNGLGVFEHHQPRVSAYLWAGCNHYADNGYGKYIADNQWDDDAVSEQIGAAAIIKQLVTQNVINIKPSSGGRAILETKVGTFFKQKPIQAALLPSNQKVAIAVNQNFQVVAWRLVNDHYLVTLGQTLNGFNTWWVYREHCEIT